MIQNWSYFWFTHSPKIKFFRVSTLSLGEGNQGNPHPWASDDLHFCFCFWLLVLVLLDFWVRGQLFSDSQLPLLKSTDASRRKYKYWAQFSEVPSYSRFGPIISQSRYLSYVLKQIFTRIRYLFSVGGKKGIISERILRCITSIGNQKTTEWHFLNNERKYLPT